MKAKTKHQRESTQAEITERFKTLLDKIRGDMRVLVAGLPPMQLSFMRMITGIYFQILDEEYTSREKAARARARIFRKKKNEPSRKTSRPGIPQRSR